MALGRAAVLAVVLLAGCDVESTDAVPAPPLPSETASSIASASPTPAVESAAAASAPAPVRCPSSHPTWRQLAVVDESGHYDLTLSIGKLTKRAEHDNEGPPGELAVCPKGSAKPLDRIAVRALAPRAAEPDYEPELHIADFDFDGRTDVTVHVGDWGPYGAPTLDVYLFRKPTFIRAPQLSNLFEQSIGKVALDPPSRQLRIASKDGCCFYWFEWHELRGGKLRKVKRETTDDGYTLRDKCTVTTEMFGPRPSKLVRACRPDETFTADLSSGASPTRTR